MWSLLKLAIPSWGVYAIVALAFAAWGGWCGFKGYSMGMENYNELRISLAAQAAEQEANTRSTIKAHKKLMEAIDEKAKLQKDLDAARLADADKRLREFTSSRPRLLSPAPSGSPNNLRVCAPREELDRLLGDAINRVVKRHAERDFKRSEEGNRGINVAILCQQWAKGFQ